MNSLKQCDELIFKMRTHWGFLSNSSCPCVQSQVPTNNNIKQNTTIQNQLERIVNDSETKMLQKTREKEKKKLCN